MKSTILSALSFILIFASEVLADGVTPTVSGLKPMKTLDCYKSNGTLIKMEEYDFATDGWCQQLCGGGNYPVMATTAGSMCYCGDTIPARDQIVPKSNCNSPCNGYNLTLCGGFGYWQLYLTGLTNDVKIQPNGSASASGSSSTPTMTKAAETVVVTSAAVDSSSIGSNKVGIAVGVVVTVVGVASIFGGLFYYLKQKQKRAIEDEHRRLEAAAAIAAAEKNSDAASSHTDQRLDPSNIYSHRRESIGSIADEMDFSRRILQVRNPDRYSTNSPAP